ncbi:MAG: CHAT domain-containing protein [Phyllobacteriaceae bacterium]|nr:CHAT domain-containing protein [Phyllobacteriaceae bacterium]
MASPVEGEKQPETGAPAGGPVVRHPYLDAPETIQPGERIAVTVALTLDPLTPGVTAKAAPGGKLTTEGALELPLPADAESWPIDVDLIAPGFDAADGEPLQRRIVLYRDNDSDFARFDLTLRSDAVTGTTRRLAARFYHAGRFLGSAARPVVVAGNGQPAQPSALSSSGPMAQGEAIDLDVGGSVPDMDVLVQFEDPARPRHAAVYIHSPHIAGAIVGSFDLPDDAVGWIEANYAQMVTLGSRLRSASSLTAAADGDPAAQRKRIVAFAEGFGDQLYRRYTPREFRQVFVQLRAEKRLSSLLVSSNSPAFPWELVFAPGGDGEPGGFLGITYRIGRWTPRDDGGLSDRPGGEIVFNGVAAVAPHYAGRQALPFQQREIDALSALSGFDAIGGDYAAFEALVRDPVGRFVHFSGHGAIGDPLAGEAPFAILLEDERIDPTTWRRIAGAADPARRPFYFFNACDSGAAKVMGGFVQGWGATVLESGAGGFIGGMWPLSDETAATFAAEYYARLVGGLAADRVRIADVLREVRRGFYATGDPTYLAYTFYGDPNLTVIRQQP